MPEPIFRGIRPGDQPTPKRYNVLAPPRNSVLDSTLLGHDILGVPTHWRFDAELQKKRSWLCDGMADVCAYCGTEPLVGLYFIAAWDHANQCRYVLRLGDEGAKAVEERAARTGRLRGMRCNLYDAIGRYGRAIMCTESLKDPLTPLVSPHPIDQIVARLLRIEHLPGWLTRRQLAEMQPEGGEQ